MRKITFDGWQLFHFFKVSRKEFCTFLQLLESYDPISFFFIKPRDYIKSIPVILNGTWWRSAIVKNNHVHSKLYVPKSCYIQPKFFMVRRDFKDFKLSLVHLIHLFLQKIKINVILVRSFLIILLNLFHDAISFHFKLLSYLGYKALKKGFQSRNFCENLFFLLVLSANWALYLIEYLLLGGRSLRYSSS